MAAGWWVTPLAFPCAQGETDLDLEAIPRWDFGQVKLQARGPDTLFCLYS